MIGDTISHYRILGPLGSGGMGQVYKAEDTRLGRFVALKFLSPDLETDAAARERFEREARAVSALNHPGICILYDIGEHAPPSGGAPRPYLVMELLEGQTLRERMAGRPLPADDFLDISIQIADALEAAHSLGIIHRDLKPANIFITTRGQAKILDFGLAKQAALPGAGHDDPTVDSGTAMQLTSPGSTLGTIAYMSPEQARGVSLDARSDLFSLGSVLYEMATGNPAFAGNTSAVIFDNILNRAPTPPSQLNPGLPPKLEEILGKALEKDRELRYQTAAEMRADLKRLKRDLSSARTPAVTGAWSAPSVPGSAASPTPSSPMPAVPGSGSNPAWSPSAAASGWAVPASGPVLPAAAVPPPTAPGSSVSAHSAAASPASAHPRARGLILTITVLVLLIVIAGVYEWHRLHQTVGKSSPAEMTVTPETSTGTVAPAAISPDGKWMAYATSQQGQTSIHIRQLATGSDAQALPPAPGDVAGLTFSPDGNYLYYSFRPPGEIVSTLYAVPSLGGIPRTVVRDVDSPISFAPDGKSFVFVRDAPGNQSTTVLIAYSDGSGEHALAQRASPHSYTDGGPAWSPDGKLVALGAKDVGQPTVFYPLVLDVASGRETREGTRDWGYLRQFAWLSGGHGIVFSGAAGGQLLNSQLWLLTYPGAEARRITNDLNLYTGASITADGNSLLVIQATIASDIWIIPWAAVADPNVGNAITSRTQIANGYTGIAWLSDGRIINSFYGNGQIGMMESDTRGNSPRHLQMPTLSNSAPSPCQNRGFVYSGGRYFNSAIYLQDPRGSHQISPGPHDAFPVCSPDGKWLIYNADASSNTHLMKLALDNPGKPLPFGGDAKSGNVLASFSPDGRWVAAFGNPAAGDTSRNAIVILDAQDGSQHAAYSVPSDTVSSTEGGRVLTWAPDGSGVIFIRHTAEVGNLWLQPVDPKHFDNAAAPREVTHYPSGDIFSVTFSPDGKGMAISTGHDSTDAVLISNFR
jgi:serine/threonine protein kinase/Tol biopolymer transport system component